MTLTRLLAAHGHVLPPGDGEQHGWSHNVLVVLGNTHGPVYDVVEFDGDKLRLGGKLVKLGAPRDVRGLRPPWPDLVDLDRANAEFLQMLYSLFTCRCRLTVNGITIATNVDVAITCTAETVGPNGVPHIATYITVQSISDGLATHSPRSADDWNDIEDVDVVLKETATLAVEASLPTNPSDDTPQQKKQRAAAAAARKGKETYHTGLAAKRPNHPLPDVKKSFYFY